MAQLVPENLSKRLDNLGRITIPKGLRDRMYLGDNAELEFFTAMVDGRHCICLASPDSQEEELGMARDIFKKYGIEIEEVRHDI